MVWFKLNSEFPELLVTIAEQIEPTTRDDLLHLARIRGLAAPEKITRQTTLGELLDILAREK